MVSAVRYGEEGGTAGPRPGARHQLAAGQPVVVTHTWSTWRRVTSTVMRSGNHTGAAVRQIDGRRPARRDDAPGAGQREG